MASFVESATLKVIDQATKPIQKINAELKKLQATAKSLKSVKIDIGVNTKSITDAVKQLDKLKSAIKSIKDTKITIRVDSSQVVTAQRRVNALAQSLRNLGRAGGTAGAQTPQGPQSPQSQQAAVQAARQIAQHQQTSLAAAQRQREAVKQQAKETASLVFRSREVATAATQARLDANESAKATRARYAEEVAATYQEGRVGGQVKKLMADALKGADKQLATTKELEKATVGQAGAQKSVAAEATKAGEQLDKNSQYAKSMQASTTGAATQAANFAAKVRAISNAYTAATSGTMTPSGYRIGGRFAKQPPPPRQPPPGGYLPPPPPPRQPPPGGYTPPPRQPPPGGYTPPPGPSLRSRLFQGGGAAAARGAGQFGQGFATGIAGPIGMFGALTAAGYAAAKALEFVGAQAATRDRADLQASVQASKKQRDIFDTLGGETPPLGATGVVMTQDERKKLWVSLLGDVQGGEEERARSAFNIVKRLETEMLPRMVAMDPEKGRADVLKGMRMNIQAMNLATGQMVDNAGNFTKDGERVYQAITAARAANPELASQLIKTTTANLKTAAYAFDQDMLTRVFINAGERGQRAGNEAYQAWLAATGTVDNKALNNSLEDLKLLTGASHNLKTGSVETGTGTPVHEELLRRNPAKWYYEQLTPRITADEQAKENAQAKKERRQPTKLAFEDIDNEKVADWIQRKFPSMRQTAKQGIADFILGYKQMQSTLAQSALAISQDVSEAVSQSWTQEGENLMQAFRDRAAKTGKNMLTAIDASGHLEDVANMVRGDTASALQKRIGLLKKGFILEDKDNLTPSDINAIKDLRFTKDPVKRAAAAAAFEVTRQRLLTKYEADYQDFVKKEAERAKIVDDRIKAIAPVSKAEFPPEAGPTKTLTKEERKAAYGKEAKKRKSRREKRAEIKPPIEESYEESIRTSPTGMPRWFENMPPPKPFQTKTAEAPKWPELDTTQIASKINEAIQISLADLNMDPMTKAADSITSSASRFETAFSTGATSIAEAGTSAGTSIASGMKEGASAAGATIASAISTAAANVHITVDVPNMPGAGGGGNKPAPDTGVQRA